MSNGNLQDTNVQLFLNNLLTFRVHGQGNDQYDGRRMISAAFIIQNNDDLF